MLPKDHPIWTTLNYAIAAVGLLGGLWMVTLGNFSEDLEKELIKGILGIASTVVTIHLLKGHPYATPQRLEPLPKEEADSKP